MEVSKVEVIVLGLLAEEALYGYELLERARDRGLGSWVEVSRASVYQGLRRLEHQGSLAGRNQDGTEGPDRRVYRISRQGRDRLRRGLMERFGDGSPYETGAGLALGFSHLLSADDARRGIVLREQAIADVRARLAEARRRLQSARGSGTAIADRMLGQQEALARAEGTWLAAFKRDLGKLRR